MLLKYIIILFVLLAACDTYVEDQRTAEFQPMYFQDPEETDDDTDFGSIYQQDKGVYSLWRRGLTE